MDEFCIRESTMNLLSVSLPHNNAQQMKSNGFYRPLSTRAGGRDNGEKGLEPGARNDAKIGTYGNDGWSDGGRTVKCS